jgi:hypothetical protein
MPNAFIETLANQDAATLFATHKIVFKVSDGDLTQTTEDAAQTLSFNLPLGSLVEVVGVKINEELADASDGTFTTVTLAINKAAGAAGAASVLMSAKGVGTAATVAYLNGTVTFPGVVTGSDETLDLVFDPADTFILANLDQGELVILLRMIPLAQL